MSRDSDPATRVAVLGAGPMGLACALGLLDRGYAVDIYEADDRIGGMSAHFDFDGLSIERYYHFICKPDQPMFDELERLGIADTLRWSPTRMGYYYEGRLHEWGNPVALLRFPRISLLSRLRYGLHMFLSAKRRRWEDLDEVNAVAWIRRWIGPEAYAVLWERLFRLKFHHFTDNLSAAWIWSRIRRVGNSRRSLMQEEMGYLEGGSETILEAWRRAIEGQGGRIHLKQPVTGIERDESGGFRLATPQGEAQADRVISTIPLPFVPRIAHCLPEAEKARYAGINNIGVVCLIYKLKKPVTENFWLNVSDPDMAIPGIIEYSNLTGQEPHIVYVPYYLPREHEKFQEPDNAFIAEATGYLKRINPELTDEDIIAINVSRYGHAQPICEPGFAKKLPDIRTSVPGLYVADTSHYYPEDRSISESTRLGKRLAAMLAEDDRAC